MRDDMLCTVLAAHVMLHDDDAGMMDGDHSLKTRLTCLISSIAASAGQQLHHLAAPCGQTAAALRDTHTLHGSLGSRAGLTPSVFYDL